MWRTRMGSRMLLLLGSLRSVRRVTRSHGSRKRRPTNGALASRQQCPTLTPYLDRALLAAQPDRGGYEYGGYGESDPEAGTGQERSQCEIAQRVHRFGAGDKVSTLVTAE